MRPSHGIFIQLLLIPLLMAMEIKVSLGVLPFDAQCAGSGDVFGSPLLFLETAALQLSDETSVDAAGALTYVCRQKSYRNLYSILI